MIISKIQVQKKHQLRIFSEDGRVGVFDVSPYLNSEAFLELNNVDSFVKINNGKYFVEWDCGADLSADTIESEWCVSQGLAED
ncbi:MAG: DUF2442 domain-containing protein [Gammaproteobacteria bacterium]|nr:DUF2442 domain-containing protein [Gammaproteobacteria bacterium]